MKIITFLLTALGWTLYAEKVLAEFGKARPNQPFLLFLSFLNPHDICYKAGAIPGFPESLPPDTARETVRLLAKQKALTPGEYRRQVPPRAANRAPINGEQPNLVSTGPRAWDDAQWDLYNWMYHRLTESVDAQIGRVLAALQKSGLEDNTIIVFTSDHGDMNGAHGLAMKGVMFEECQRVPFIFVGPGIQRGVADRRTLTCNGLDLLPTICDLAGFTPPAGLPGVSLKPFLQGAGPTPERQYIVTESHNAHQVNDGAAIAGQFTVFRHIADAGLLGIGSGQKRRARRAAARSGVEPGASGARSRPADPDWACRFRRRSTPSRKSPCRPPGSGRCWGGWARRPGHGRSPVTAAPPPGASLVMPFRPEYPSGRGSHNLPYR